MNFKLNLVVLLLCIPSLLAEFNKPNCPPPNCPQCPKCARCPTTDPSCCEKQCDFISVNSQVCALHKRPDGFTVPFTMLSRGCLDRLICEHGQKNWRFCHSGACNSCCGECQEDPEDQSQGYNLEDGSKNGWSSYNTSASISVAV